jgi:predicted O-methyltransferase YrrM
MLTINNKKYHCNPSDYDPIHIQEFCNLKIYKKVGELERYIGLINDLSELYSAPELIIHGLKYSSFVSYNCVSKFEKMRIIDVMFQNNNNKSKEDDLENTKINLDDFNLESGISNKVSITIINPESNEANNIETTNETIVFCLDSEFDILINNKNLMILSHENELYNSNYNYKYKLADSNYVLYVPDRLHDSFLSKFHYYVVNNNTEDSKITNNEPIKFHYDNLIHLCVMVKNGGNDFKEMLIKNLPIIDRWTILDTGSTDDTIKNINEVLVGKKKGNLYQEAFINFRESRNRCLELAGYNCKFKLMLDDTYVIEGRLREFLNICRGDQFADSYSLLIKSGDTSYYSNRVTKSLNNLKYIYTIHEVIQRDNNINVVIPDNFSHIFDMRSDFMEKRTMDRKNYDLEQLFLMMEEYPDDPRHLYYIAQTYNLLSEPEKAAEYFHKRAFHPIEGFDQEKVDALFEMTRLYNFTLKKPWEECEKYYNLVHEWDPERPEASYFLAIHYYLEGDMKRAYDYFSRAFKIGFPIHRQYSLKPTLSYSFTPKFLAKLCYQFENYELGYKATSLFLQHNTPKDDEYENILSFHNIFRMVNAMPEIKIIPIIPNKPVICFVADGGFKKWSGSSIVKEGVGGSETYIIEMARYIQKHSFYEVVVFCNCEQSEIFEGVKYLPLHEFLKYASELQFEHCVISRFSEYIPVAIRGHVNNIHLVVHDLTMSGNIIPNHPKIKNIFCLTDWHKSYFLERFQVFKDITHGFHYGIDFTHFKYENNAKITNSFIYSSFPNRGLLVVLKTWPKIIKKYPDATLNIFCDMNNAWSNQNFPEEMKTIKELLEDLANYGVVNHGWVSKETLGRYWKQSSIWFYPCKFKETFCLTALEAALSKTFAITNNLASLQDTVGDRGVSLPGDVMEQEWQDNAFNVICEYLDEPGKMKDYVQRNYEWALKHSWEQRAVELLKQIEFSTNIKTKVNSIISNSNISNIQLNYANMYNWTNDLPKGHKVIFEQVLDLLKDKCNKHSPKVLEIGTFSGTSLINILNRLGSYSTGVAIDRWENYEEKFAGNTIDILKNVENNKVESIFHENVKSSGMENRIRALKGDSVDKLLELISKHEKFDFIYVDGSHRSYDCFADCILGWKLLEQDGILAIDDYQYKIDESTTPEKERPYEGVNEFLEKYKGQYEVINISYRVFIRKL